MSPGSQVIVVLSPKGGTGKTTVSTNLAVGLARRRPGDVLLVDFDLAFGDVAAALLLEPRHGLLDVAAGEAPKMHASGLHVVAAPDTPMPVASFDTVALSAALEVVTDRYPIVVVDTGAGFDGVTRLATERATDIVLVASMDVPTLLGLRKVLRWMDGLGQTAAARHLVLNRADTTVGLDLDDVQATLNLPPAVTIPNAAAVTRSVNEGRPLTQDDAAGPAAAAFAELVERFAGSPEPRDRRVGAPAGSELPAEPGDPAACTVDVDRRAAGDR